MYIAVVCGTPEYGTNTVVVDPTIYLTYGQTYEYTCLPSYTTNDTVEVECLANGQFSSPPPKCSKQVFLARINVLATVN